MTDYKARLLLFDADLLLKFQCLIIDYVIQIKNRVSINALLFGDGRLSTIKTLYDVYCDKVPNLEHLKAFGCIIYLIL